MFHTHTRARASYVCVCVCVTFHVSSNRVSVKVTLSNNILRVNGQK